MVNRREASMPRNVPVLTRVSPELKAKLKVIAADLERSESYIAAQALASYVEHHEWQAGLIRSRLAHAEAGGATVPHEDVAAWLDAKGTRKARPRPRGRPGD
jgi:predicted transcriptional regulator